MGDVEVVNIVSDDDLQLVAESGSILDDAISNIQVRSDAILFASERIELADVASSVIQIGGNTDLASVNIIVGQDGMAAGDSLAINSQFGSLTFNATETAAIVEDDPMLLTSFNGATDVFLSAFGRISNTDGATFNVSHYGQFNSTNVELGNQTDDQFQVARLGVVAENALFGLNYSTEIDGVVPNESPAIFGSEESRGTSVSQTLFIGLNSFGCPGRRFFERWPTWNSLRSACALGKRFRSQPGCSDRRGEIE